MRPTNWYNWCAALDEGIELKPAAYSNSGIDYLGKTVIWIAVDGTVQGIMEFRMP